MNCATFSTATLASLALFLSACDKPEPRVNEVSSISHATSSAPVTDKWVGQWNGPEGSFLRITGSGGAYEITIQNLDGQLTYAGTSVENEIQFERNSIKETIQATNGEQTGMKWLSDKTNCLTIHSGEGYCKN
jgi:hypothetical protein